MLRNHPFCFGFEKENCPDQSLHTRYGLPRPAALLGVAVFPTGHPSNCIINPNEHRAPPRKAAGLTAVPANFTQACGGGEL